MYKLNFKKQGIVIQCRMGSIRFPGKMNAKFHEDLSILDILLIKLKKYFKKEEIYLATSNQKENEILLDIAGNHEINSFTGSEDNVLTRFIDCAEHFEIDLIYRVCADNPFFQPNYLLTLKEQLINLKLDYCSFQWPDGTPVIKSHIGAFGEIITLNALKKIQGLTNEKIDQEHVTNYLYEHKGEFNCNFVELPIFVKESRNIRLTVDTKNDFEILKKLYSLMIEIHGEIDFKELIKYVSSNVKLLKVMEKEILLNEK